MPPEIKRMLVSYREKDSSKIDGEKQTKTPQNQQQKIWSTLEFYLCSEVFYKHTEKCFWKFTKYTTKSDYKQE